MRKSLLTCLLALLMGTSVFALDREHVLKVYNWADYIDEDVLKAFPSWYKEQTGDTVEIIYQTFDINENMLTEIEMGGEDYDVICPSEYIIERMLRLNLLLPIKRNYGEMPDYTQLVSPWAQDMFNQMSDSLKVTDYAVGYMWGTTGFLYNPKHVSGDSLKSWGAILNPAYENKIFMKDAFRDVYSVIVLYAYREDIKAGKVTRSELVAHPTQERIDTVQAILMAARKNVAGWEVDFGKEMMTKGEAWMNLSWSGDAQWAIDEAKECGLELKYIVPEEGSNVWFDGWCIPKYAQNTKAASYFINYLCMPENMIKNMEAIGYVSVIACPEILEWAQDSTIEETADLTYFFGEGAKTVHVNQVFYPDQSVIDRCALMHDSSEWTGKMLEMWGKVKGDNLSGRFLWIVIAILAIIIVVVIINFSIKKRYTEGERKHRKSKKNK